MGRYFHILADAMFVLILSASLSVPVHADNAPKLNADGIDAYRDGDIETSVRKFTEALVERPEAPELRFNRGTALSVAGQTEEAVTELLRAAGAFEDSALTAAARFNAGNTQLAAGNAEAAVEEYRQAIMLDQSAEDYRKNLEIALRQQQQQQQEQQDDDQQEDQQEQSEEQQDQQQPEEQEDQSEQQDQQQQQPQQTDQEQQQEQQPLTPEQARQLLDAMQNEEDEAFELKRQMIQEAMKPGDDW